MWICNFYYICYFYSSIFIFIHKIQKNITLSRQQVEDTITTNYTYSNMMRLLSKTEGGTSTTFGYDRNGNLTSKTEGNSSYTYVWDYDNRLKEVRQDGNLLFSYTYDPNGRRVRSFNMSCRNILFRILIVSFRLLIFSSFLFLSETSLATIKIDSSFSSI